VSFWLTAVVRIHLGRLMNAGCRTLRSNQPTQTVSQPYSCCLVFSQTRKPSYHWQPRTMHPQMPSCFCS